jgi:hypothetical protein
MRRLSNIEMSPNKMNCGGDFECGNYWSTRVLQLDDKTDNSISNKNPVASNFNDTY